MFCPNCGSSNQPSYVFCRACGLKLDEVKRVVAEQIPSEEFAALQRRKELFERLGLFSLAISGIVGISMLVWKVGEIKASIFGPEVLIWSAFGALAFFGLASVFFFNYPRWFMDFEKLNPRLDPAKPEIESKDRTTAKLLEDPIFEPASVTEDSTELLATPRVKTKSR